MMERIRADDEDEDNQRRLRASIVVEQNDWSARVVPSPLSKSSISTLDFIQNLKVDAARIQVEENDMPSYALSPLLNRKVIAADLRHLDGEGDSLRSLVQQRTFPPTIPSVSAARRAGPVRSNSDFRLEMEPRRKRPRLCAGGLSPSHLTPLYQAVSAGAPIDIIQSLVREDPPSVSYQNGGGLIPLHCAIERYDTPESLLLLLLESDPHTASLKCKRGFTPVDLLWKRYADPDVYRSDQVKARASRLRAAMEQATKTIEDEELLEAELGSSAITQRQAHAMHVLQDTQELRDFWELMTKFIQAACHGTTSAESPGHDGRKNRIVHDVVALQCHPRLLRFAAALHPEQLLERDEVTGRLPLHIAASQSSPLMLQTILNLEPRTISARDRNGQLPLHLAIQSRLPWEGAIEQLVTAWPQSLLLRDARTGLLPVMLASAAGCSTNTIFHLVSASPMEICRLGLQSSNAN